MTPEQEKSLKDLETRMRAVERALLRLINVIDRARIIR